MTTSDAIRLGLSWLGTYGLHSTLLIAVAWAWCRWCPPRALRERERIWRWALLGGLLTATIQTGLGPRALAWSFEWPTVADRLEATPARLDRAAEPVLEPSAEPRPARTAARRSPRPARVHPPAASLAHLPARSVEPATEPSATSVPDSTPAAVEIARHEPVAAPSTSTGPTSSEALPPIVVGILEDAPGAVEDHTPISWPGLVAAGWASVASLGVLGMLLSWNALRRRMAGCVPITSGPLLERFEALRARTGLRGRVRLSTSASLCSPFSVGLLRPEVCIPLAVVTDLGQRQQDAILAHELAHVRRRDPAWACLLAWLERLLFFQPLNRLARHELAELAELACDEQAVSWTGGRLTLAGTLTEVAGWVLEGRPQPARLPGLVGHRSRLARRVARLLEDDAAREPDGTRWWAVPVGVLALAGFTVAAPGVASKADPSSVADAVVDRARLAPEEGAPDSAASEAPALPPAAPAAAGPDERTAPTAPAPLADELLEEEQRRLAEELELLRASLADLSAELAGTELGETFAQPLAQLQARLAELDGQHARIRDLLARLRAAVPARSPIPHTSEPTIR